MSELYRLRGDVGGVERTYTLGPGETRIGSVKENDIVLPVRGVSRHHGRLRLAAGGIVIEDLESRNGLFVNGARAVSARLKAGDEIRMGPVTLRLEPIDPSDAILGVDLGKTPALRHPGLPSEETTSVSAPPEASHAAAWLRVFDGVLENLSLRPEPNLRGALTVVLRELTAVGCCVFELLGAEAVSLAAAGSVGDLGFLGPMKASAGFGTGGPGSDAVTWRLLQGPSGTIGMAIWGDYPGRSASDAPLRTLLRLWQRLQPDPVRSLQQPGTVPPQELVFPEGSVPGESSAMRALYAQMRPLAQGDIPVLILGETGVGKELVAHTLHASSRRPKGPFVAVNCAAIPADQLEAEMFGVARGAATGVVERPGKFRLAQGGTLFLDEIGDMPLELQAKLLRALQEKEIQPVGSGPVPVDVRVVTATNTDIHQRMDQGRFRRDLYFRIAGYVLPVPPLRERRDDVPALVESFLRAFSRECGKKIRGVTLKALRALTDYHWPGNVRELEHEVRRLAYLCPDGEAVDSSMVSPHLLAPPATSPQPTFAADAPLDLNLERNLQQVETLVCRRALDQAGGNRTQAAKLLGISRNGLAIKMRRLGLAE